MPKPDHRSQMARAWLHFHAARKGRGSGSAAPRVDWPVYPRRVEHSRVVKGEIDRRQRTAFWRFPPLHQADLEGQQRVDSTHCGNDAPRAHLRRNPRGQAVRRRAGLAGARFRVPLIAPSGLGRLAQASARVCLFCRRTAPVRIPSVPGINQAEGPQRVGLSRSRRFGE